MDIVSIGTLILALAAVCGFFIQNIQLKNSQKLLKLSQDELTQSQEQFIAQMGVDRLQLTQSQEQFIAQMKADHLQRRREAALRLWDDWENTFNKERRFIVLVYLKWAETEGNKETRSQWINLISYGGRAPRDQFEKATVPELMKELLLVNYAPINSSDKPVNSIKGLEALREALVSCLDIMEKVAAAYHYSVAETEMLDKAFKDNIVRLTNEMSELIKEFRKHDNCQTSWQLLTDLVENGEWRTKTLVQPRKKAADSPQ